MAAEAKVETGYECCIYITGSTPTRQKAEGCRMGLRGGGGGG